MKQRKIYISGKISGLRRKDYMYRFADVAQMLRQHGYDVLNPTRLAPCRWPWLYRLMGYRMTLSYDLWWLRLCDGIYVMWGSSCSRGSRLEQRKAHEWGIETISL